MPTVHLDFETRSAADLKKVGAVRYAMDPTTEILCMACRVDDGPVLLWKRGDPPPYFGLLDLIAERGVPPTHTLTPAEARAIYRDRRAFTQPDPPPGHAVALTDTMERGFQIMVDQKA